MPLSKQKYIKTVLRNLGLCDVDPVNCWSTNEVICTTMLSRITAVFNRVDAHDFIPDVIYDTLPEYIKQEEEQLRALMLSLKTELTEARNMIVGIQDFESMLDIFRVLCIDDMVLDAISSIKHIREQQLREPGGLPVYIEASISALLSILNNVNSVFTLKEMSEDEIEEAVAVYDSQHVDSFFKRYTKLTDLAAKATRLPWCLDTNERVRIYGVQPDNHAIAKTYGTELNNIPVASMTGEEQRNNAEYIVAACNEAPRLYQELEYARSVISKLEAELKSLRRELSK